MNKRLWIPLFLSIILIFALFLTKNTTNPTVLSVFDENSSFFNKLLPSFSKQTKENKFSEIINRTKNKKGIYGIYIKEISGNQEFAYNKNELFYGASLYKVPIAAAALKEIELGNKTSEQEIEILGHEFADGTGSLNSLQPGVLVEYGFIIDKLLKESDNTAQNILWRIVPQQQIISAFNIITIKTYFYVNNTVTPAQIGNLLENIITGDYLSTVSKEILLNKMSSTLFDDRIHQGLSEDTKFSHKIGNWPETSSWHDCGIATRNNKKIVVCVMSRNTTYENFLEVTKDVGEFVNILF